MSLSISGVRSVASNMTWYVRTFLSEMRSLPHRIHTLSQKTNRQRFPLDLGPLYEQGPGGENVPCKATIARTQYIEFVLARYPWASETDLLFALDGWNKGAEYLAHISDTSSMGEHASKGQYPLALVEQ